MCVPIGPGEPRDTARSPKDVRKHKRGCDMRSNPTCQHTPTRGYQGTVLIHGSLGTGAFSNSPALNPSLTSPRTLSGPPLPVARTVLGTPRRRNLKPEQNQKKKLDEKDAVKKRDHLEPKPLTYRTSAEEVLQQTNVLVLIVNHVRSRFGVNPCGEAIAKSNVICNGKYAEEVSPKSKLQGYFYRGRTSSASFW